MLSESVAATNLISYDRFESNSHFGPLLEPEEVCKLEVNQGIPNNFTSLAWDGSSSGWPSGTQYHCFCLSNPGDICGTANPICPAGYVSQFHIVNSPDNPEAGCHSTPHSGLVCDALPSSTPPLMCALLPDGQDPIKNNGNQCSAPMSLDPINTATGNSFQTETDYKGNSTFPLTFVRYYNSAKLTMSTTVFGDQWRHTYSRSIRLFDSHSSIPTLTAYRSDGVGYYFTQTNGIWSPDADVTMTLTELKDINDVRTGWELNDNNDNVELYNATGQLLSITNRAGLTQTLDYALTTAQGGDDNSDTLDKVTGSFGRTLQFSYSNGKLDSLTDPAGEVYTYAYNTNGYLGSVTYPDETPANSADNPQRIYLYEDLNFPQALTGITDENNQRFSTWAFDAEGRAIMNEHAGGADHGEITYNADGTSTVTHASGMVETMHFANLLGVAKVTTIDGDPCTSCAGQNKATTYDTNGFLASRTDFEDNQTTFIYNTRGLEEERIDAVGTPAQRKIITQWHTNYRVPTQIDVFDNNNTHLKSTTFTYDASGRVEARTETDLLTSESRTTTTTYDPVTQQIATIDGPRIDVNDITTNDYDPATGNLTKVTNAQGHETTFSNHDANGRPQTITDPNGLITTLTYHPRGWLLTRTVDGNTTIFDYDNIGQLIKLTLPTNAFISYTYDAAHQLTDITDNLGNTIHYTLDPMGNRSKEETKDNNGNLKRILEREYDQLNQLLLLIGGEGQLTRYTYDLNSNQTALTDPRNTGSDRAAAKTLDPLQTNNTSQSLYDALNRLVEVVQLQAASNSGDDVSTTYDYNALDQLIKVTDPTGLETNYTYNALGDLLQLNSPDTGITSYTYDEAGNRITQTDARNITTSYTYDALNRLNTVSYPDTSLNVTYTYDENGNNQNGIGRLTTMTDASGSTEYSYDKRGNQTGMIITRGAVMLTTSYAYNSADQLIQLTYPSGRTVDYSYDAANRISDVSTTDSDGNTQALLSNIDYQPFGPMNAMTYGNNLTNLQSYDLDYRLTSFDTAGILERGYSFDEASNITNISNTLNATTDQTFIYDGLSRLEDAQGNYGSLAYQYDKTSNRTSKTDNGITDTYNYSVDSHHLQDRNSSEIYAYDANGNTTQLPNPDIFTDLTYGDHNRLTEVNGVIYTYNGRGERVIKDDASTITHYYYDQNGQLIAETDATGNTDKEYLTLNGQLIALTGQGTAGGTTETLLDNPTASFSDNWPLSTSVSGFEGVNYQYHAGGAAGPGTLGTPIDNTQASYTDTWTNSTSVKQFYQTNYQYHAGSTASGPGILGTPVDNQQATFTGSWNNSTSVKQFYASNYQYHAAGTGANTATWNTNVSSSGSYDVYVNWAAHANRASNAKYTINHTTGSDTVTVNQQQNGAQWNLLGTYTLDSSSTISLSDDADGYVIADAISVLPAGTPPNPTQPPAETATWALNASTTASYDVYANWAAHSNRASNAKYTINHTSGSDMVTVNQKQNGGQWNLLGTYTLDSNSTVDLSSEANGYVIADGITILPAGTPPTTTPQGETATWVLNQSGDTDVYVKWTAHANRATDAKYTINHINGSTTVTVNQQQSGGQWNLLGSFTLDTSSTLELSSEANGYVIADGVRLVTTTAGTSSGVYYVHNDHLGTPQTLTDTDQTIVWAAEYDPFGKANITIETVTNNIRFPGQYFDGETGLHYNYFRTYDPSTGRYITSDPIGLGGGVSTYGYVGGSPLNWTDRRGLVAQCALIPVCVQAVIQVCRHAVTKIAQYVAVGIAYEMVDCDGDSCSGEDEGEGEGASDKPPVRDIDFIPGKPDTANPTSPTPIDEAIDTLKGGGDVISTDEKTARDIADKAGKGQPVFNPPHAPGQRPHYHPTDAHGQRLPGHSLF